MLLNLQLQLTRLITTLLILRILYLYQFTSIRKPAYKKLSRLRSLTIVQLVSSSLYQRRHLGNSRFILIKTQNYSTPPSLRPLTKTTNIDNYTNINIEVANANTCNKPNTNIVNVVCKTSSVSKDKLLSKNKLLSKGKDNLLAA